VADIVALVLISKLAGGAVVNATLTAVFELQPDSWTTAASAQAARSRRDLQFIADLL